MSSKNIDKADPTFELKLGEKLYPLKFSFGSLRRVELLTGKNCVNGEFLSNLGANEIVTMIWATLIGTPLTIDEVGDLMPLGRAKEIVDLLVKAYGAAQPAPPTEGAELPKN